MLDEGSLFSESDWLIVASAISPSVTIAGPLFNPEELASSVVLASPLILVFFATHSASVTSVKKKSENTAN